MGGLAAGKDGGIQNREKKLNNQGFVAKAPAAVLDQQRESLKKVLEKIAMLENSIAEIEKSL